MELTDIVRNIAGGFTVGFALGISGICYKRGERIDIIETTFSEEELAKNIVAVGAALGVWDAKTN